MRVLVTMILAMPLSLAACGSSSSPPPSVPRPVSGPPKVQIAKTVNAFFHAWQGGDGQLACSYLTPRGQQVTVKLIRQAHDLRSPITETDCVGVVEQSAKAISRPIGERVTTSQVTVESANRATVASKFRGAIDLRKVDGTWLLRIPVFLD